MVAKGSHLSQESRDKISAANIGKHKHETSPETRAKLSIAGYKRWESKEERKKFSARMMGNKYAYKPHLHLTQKEIQKGFDDYVKLHGKKPYPAVLTREQIKERLAPLKIVPKPMGNPAPKNRKDK
ncbi:MAG: NUMOD3 domain-containing DNA-binding protein [Anaerolineales bacterium]|jgi:hypothetical protein